LKAACAGCLAKESEELDIYEHGGLAFRNQPLAYWIDTVRHQADPDSPVLIVQSKCDRPEQEALPFPVAAEVLNALRYRKQLHVSAKERHGEAALKESLREAITWLRDPARLGSPQISAGRLRVQRGLEALREADMQRPRDQRQHQWMEQSDFKAICAEEGGVTALALLLAYLDANGTVFYRLGVFGDRIVLDQGWALEAIYAVFDRKRVEGHNQRITRRYSTCRRANRFCSGKLALIWRLIHICIWFDDSPRPCLSDDKGAAEPY
jgi:internalin A